MGSERRFGEKERDGAFFLALGLAYTRSSLWDDARRAFEAVGEDDPCAALAAAGLAEAYLALGEYEKALAVLDRAEDGGIEPSWVAKRKGTAAFHLGRYREARRHFSRGSRVPRADAVRKSLAGVEPAAADELDPGTLFVELLARGMSPHLFFELVAAVLWGGRRASCVFLDQIEGVLGREKGGEEEGSETASSDSLETSLLSFARELFERTGLYAAFLSYPEYGPAGCGVLQKIYVSREPDLLDRVEELDRAIGEELETAAPGERRARSLVPEGRLLGYPGCCTRWASETRRRNESFETEALRALIAEECLADADGVAPPALAYFAFEFFPCDPRCPAAEARGRAILEAYERSAPWLAAIVREGLVPLNKALLYQPVGQHHELTRRFDEWTLAALGGDAGGDEAETSTQT